MADEKKTTKEKKATEETRKATKTIYNTTSDNVIQKHVDNVVEMLKECQDNEERFKSLQFILDSAIAAKKKMSTITYKL